MFKKGTGNWTQYRGRDVKEVDFHWSDLPFDQQDRRPYWGEMGLLSDGYYLDVAQALLYSEFLGGGYQRSREIFHRCFAAVLKREDDGKLGPFQKTVQYTQLLQNFVQRLGVDLPEYNYAQVGFDSKTNIQVFSCRAPFHQIAAEARDTSKKSARQKAAYALLCDYSLQTVRSRPARVGDKP